MGTGGMRVPGGGHLGGALRRILGRLGEDLGGDPTGDQELDYSRVGGLTDSVGAARAVEGVRGAGTAEGDPQLDLLGRQVDLTAARTRGLDDHHFGASPDFLTLRWWGNCCHHHRQPRPTIEPNGPREICLVPFG